MSIRPVLEAEGGITRTRVLLERGIPARRIAAAVASGVLRRPRRGWVALPHADPELLRAVEGGVVLSCITQAKRLGLWAFGAEDRTREQPHVVATRSARASAPGCVVHWASPLVPRPPGTIEDSVPNVLQYVAACRPFEQALVVWESALNRRLVELPALARLPFRGQARRLLRESRPFHDSGLESLVGHRLRWLRVRLVPQAHLYGHRVDLLIGERLVLQIDGGDHVGPQRDADNDFDSLLTRRGYHVIRVGYAAVMYRWHEVQTQIMEAVAQGLHRAV
ncbi:DUF559 domain-containing protein [Leucobacter allii]|uniref:type IV toxin-antitoxin system AbiEi family antitoxin domain-containing protein n=1 Tax=Leucobacter allii TaxID=2932247 RepID=UPI001FD0CF46|nr:type IV toxin-antitoxin system AbiEi family antitoxin domain-containing protein [Leucobacter allii]UOR00599.1 DUF559 domain-containing protein [Leucobacter allii]